MLNIFKCNPAAILPSFATEQSACFDLCACIAGQKIKCYTRMNEPVELDCIDKVEIPAEFRVLIPTGLIFDIPEYHSVRIYPRSGLSFKMGLVTQNCEGIVDSDYVEECFVLLKNDSLSRITISHGMRIAQGELVRNYDYFIAETLERPQKRTSRNGGFGSTGVS
jgi:deoxyuridine 5'-triphosphate nucleotidohydrolase